MKNENAHTRGVCVLDVWCIYTIKTTWHMEVIKSYSFNFIFVCTYYNPEWWFLENYNLLCKYNIRKILSRVNLLAPYPYPCMKTRIHKQTTKTRCTIFCQQKVFAVKKYLNIPHNLSRSRAIQCALYYFRIINTYITFGWLV